MKPRLEARDLAVLLEPFEENHETLGDVGPPTLAPDRLLAAERFTTAFLAARRDQISARAEAGLVRDCHGDLRAEHVIVDDDVAIFDCIEFNPALRWIDVAADLAFLVMDLARLGAGGVKREPRERLPGRGRRRWRRRTALLLWLLPRLGPGEGDVSPRGASCRKTTRDANASSTTRGPCSSSAIGSLGEPVCRS